MMIKWRFDDLAFSQGHISALACLITLMLIPDLFKLEGTFQTLGGLIKRSKSGRKTIGFLELLLCYSFNLLFFGSESKTLDHQT